MKIIDGIDGVEICSNGDKFWQKNGELHREDGPACEWHNGDREWYLNGMLHREDGPACEYTNGIRYWFLNNKKHRIDGPAVYNINFYGGVYYINDVQYDSLEEGLMDQALE